MAKEDERIYEWEISKINLDKLTTNQFEDAIKQLGGSDIFGAYRKEDGTIDVKDYATIYKEAMQINFPNDQQSKNQITIIGSKSDMHSTFDNPNDGQFMRNVARVPFLMKRNVKPQANVWLLPEVEKVVEQLNNENIQQFNKNIRSFYGKNRKDSSQVLERLKLKIGNDEIQMSRIEEKIEAPADMVYRDDTENYSSD